MHSAQEEKAASDSELKAARAAATPAPPPPEHPQGESGLTLSSEDMVGLHDMLQQCGLPAVAAQEEAEAAGATEGKRPRVGPYGAPTHPPREKVTLANPALVSKLAASVAYIQKHMHSPGEGKGQRKRARRGEERWGWVVPGGNTGRLRPQRSPANSPPRPRAKGVQTLSSTPPRSFTVRHRMPKCGREPEPPLPGETQTMVRVNCQNGDGGGSWVGELWPASWDVLTTGCGGRWPTCRCCSQAGLETGAGLLRRYESECSFLEA